MSTADATLADTRATGFGTATPLLRTESLAVTYADGTRALQPINCSFAPGDFVVLLGSSGAGKSTLLRCLNGLVQPTQGRVTVAGLGDIANRQVLRAHRHGLSATPLDRQANGVGQRVAGAAGPPRHLGDLPALVKG